MRLAALLTAAAAAALAASFLSASKSDLVARGAHSRGWLLQKTAC